MERVKEARKPQLRHGKSRINIYLAVARTDIIELYSNAMVLMWSRLFAMEVQAIVWVDMVDLLLQFPEARATLKHWMTGKLRTRRIRGASLIEFGEESYTSPPDVGTRDMASPLERVKPKE